MHKSLGQEAYEAGGQPSATPEARTPVGSDNIPSWESLKGSHDGRRTMARWEAGAKRVRQLTLEHGSAKTPEEPDEHPVPAL